jgi:regulator of protease activity HflC (stomatin/prohibitin superfamily)
VWGDGRLSSDGTVAVVYATSIILGVFLLFLIYRTFYIIKAHEVGLLSVFGQVHRPLKSGLHVVPPFISEVVRLDVRRQHVEVASQDLVTKDHVPVQVDVTVVLRVVEPLKAHRQVQDYRNATVDAALSGLRTTIGGLPLLEAIRLRKELVDHFREELDRTTLAWGVEVEKIEVRRIDPGESVLATMRMQAAAEREHVAAVVKASTHMRETIPEGEDDTEVETEEAQRRTRHALDYLPSGLPESLWGWEVEELAEAIANGEKRVSKDGFPLVSIRGKWYINDPRDMATFLKEWREVKQSG